MSKEQVASLRFFNADTWTVWLEIEGITGRFNLAQYSASFAKNEVPTASCLLGTGAELSRQGVANLGFNIGAMGATAEQLANLDGAKMHKAKVHMNLGPFGAGAMGPSLPGQAQSGGINSEWEPGSSEIFEGEQVIFEGYYAGLSYSRVGPQIQMSVHLVHRLVDLTFGSLWSGWMHPSNPSNLLQPAVASTMGGPCNSKFGSGGKAEPAWQAKNFLADRVKDDGPDDFGKALLGTLFCIADMDIFKLDCSDATYPKNPNTAAKEVLDGIMSKTGGLRDVLGKNAAMMASIGAYMGRLLDDTRGTTFWDFLVNKMCPDFVMALIPLPSLKSSPDGQYAYLVPDTPGLKTPYKELFLNDYSGFTMKARMWKPLYAVGVFSDGDDMSGAEMPSNKVQPRSGGQCIGGIFPNPSELEGQVGQLLLVRSPEWLSQLTTLTTAQKNFGDTGKAAHDAVDTEEDLGDPVFEPSDEQDTKADILHDYAHLLYVQNAINGRAGTFDSKLRFDIAPGSVLKLKKDARPGTTGRYMELPVDTFVQVNRVSFNINSESPQAKTSFECVHLRTEEENEQDGGTQKFSIDKHVFLEGPDDPATGLPSPYRGAPLIEKWKFD